MYLDLLSVLSIDIRRSVQELYQEFAVTAVLHPNRDRQRKVIIVTGAVFLTLT